MLQETGQLDKHELEEFQRTGMFPWSQKTIDLYTSAEESNPFIRTYPPDSINYLRSIYPEKSMLRILAMQTKEGQFLINGVQVENPENALPSGFGDFAYKSGLEDNLYVGKDVIKCHLEIDPKEEPYLERTSFSGYATRDGPLIQSTHRIGYADLEKTIPGFKFVKGACNPCKGMKGVADYSCPFELNRRPGDTISNIWKYLWGL